MHIFDSHAHYFDRRFETEFPGGAEALLHTILPQQVERILNVGTNCQNSRLAIAQAAGRDGMYAAVGIHPEDCHRIPDPEEALKELEALLGDRASRRRDKIVAIGEIGLDYHYENYDEIPLDKEKEAFFFEEQMKLAARLELPVIIHDREAHGDCFETVLRHPEVHGVFHSYSGSVEMARELTKRGWYLSFSGVLTFPNARRVREVAAAVPQERILIETDCPYLAPQPMRGRPNHSGYLPYTIAALAELLGISGEETANLTYTNATRLFLSDFC